MYAYAYADVDGDVDEYGRYPVAWPGLGSKSERRQVRWEDGKDGSPSRGPQDRGWGSEWPEYRPLR